VSRVADSKTQRARQHQQQGKMSVLATNPWLLVGVAGLVL
jgi:hypothetical protein